MTKFYVVLFCVSDINHFYFHNNLIGEEAKGPNLPKIKFLVTSRARI